MRCFAVGNAGHIRRFRKNCDCSSRISGKTRNGLNQFQQRFIWGGKPHVSISIFFWDPSILIDWMRISRSLAACSYETEPSTAAWISSMDALLRCPQTVRRQTILLGDPKCKRLWLWQTCRTHRRIHRKLQMTRQAIWAGSFPGRMLSV